MAGFQFQRTPIELSTYSLTVGTSVVQLTTEWKLLSKGVLLKASKSNEGNIYIGNDTVTTVSTPSTSGFELCAGESVYVEIDQLRRLYAIADTAGQILFMMRT